jgi:plasmid stability protein
MGDILIRGLDERTVRRLKAQAKRNGRSLQSEVRLLLKQAAGASVAEALQGARHWREKLGRAFDDSAALVREDRER